MVVFIGELIEKERTISINLPSKNPNPKEIANSRISTINTIKSNGWSEIRFLDMETQTANKIITNTSIIIVTPITVWVNGPFALSWWIIAIADDGDLATNMVAISTETANLVFSDKSTIKEILDASK